MRFRTDAERKAAFSRMQGNANNGIDASQNRFSYAPVYAAADIPAMGVDAIGTAGAGVVAWTPLITTLGIGYIGASAALKAKDRLKRQYESEKHRRKREKNEDKKLKRLYGRWSE